MNHKNNPNPKSWLPVPEGSDFPLWNLPFGIYKSHFSGPVAATRIGDTIIDLAILAEAGFFSFLGEHAKVFKRETLNDFIALGRPAWTQVRERLLELFAEGNTDLQKHVQFSREALLSANEVQMMMPVKIGDYTDFYSGIEHAINVGSMFRDPANPLLPNYRHIPVAYHGRSSSIAVSGTNFHRPKGQVSKDNVSPEFSASRNLDFELEMAFVVGKSNPIGESVRTADAEEHIFGLLLFNDLSARDIQRWEYVPLGPFLSKNFGSVLSPWIVTLDALEPFRTEGPKQEPEVLPYLQYEGKKNYNIHLEVWVKPEGVEEKRICLSNYTHLYWNICQQLAHHTINGCNMHVGDLCASGTISGPEPGSYGSLLELTWNGKNPITYADGKSRTFLEDGDTVSMKAFAEKDGLRIGFGECITKVLPAK
jgi:fumarylacetoacetase